MRDVHVVYDDGGAILAVADATEAHGAGGVVLRHHPVPGPRQHAARVRLDDEQERATAWQLVRDFEVDLTTSPPKLRRHAR
jgi:hypothetical protein